jgi:hypothetical protein
MREIINEIESKQSMAEGIYKFGSLANARNFAGRTTKPMVIILGDDMGFWVVSLVMGEQLTKSGYEAAE